MLRILRSNRSIGGVAVDRGAVRLVNDLQPVADEAEAEFPAPAPARESEAWRRLGYAGLSNTLREICTLCGWTDTGTEGGRALAITSATDGEGKSSIAQALAITLAEDHGVDVLLVEFDVLHPSLAEDLGIGPGPELTDLLSGVATLDEVLRPSGIANLWLLPAGQRGQNPSRLFRSAAVPELLDEARRRFPFVILDLPAALRSSDTAVVSRYADSVVLVIRSGVTDQRQVRQAITLLAESKLQGVILNRRRSTLPDLIRRIVES